MAARLQAGDPGALAERRIGSGACDRDSAASAAVISCWMTPAREHARAADSPSRPPPPPASPLRPHPSHPRPHPRLSLPRARVLSRRAPSQPRRPSSLSRRQPRLSPRSSGRTKRPRQPWRASRHLRSSPGRRPPRMWRCRQRPPCRNLSCRLPLPLPRQHLPLRPLPLRLPPRRSLRRSRPPITCPLPAPTRLLARRPTRTACPPRLHTPCPCRPRLVVARPAHGSSR